MIFQAILTYPGITQKELSKTTDIPAITLQWHLAQFAKYEAIKISHEKNTVHYNVLTKYVWPYHSLTRQQEKEKSDERV